MEYSMSEYSAFFRVLSNVSRFRIIQVLSTNDERISVNELAQIGNIPMSKISDQLTVLRKSEIVTFKRERTTIYYSLNKEKVISIINSYYDLLNISGNGYMINEIVSDPFGEKSFQIYKVLANETRCDMLIQIANKERYVTELCNMFYLEQPTISMHLSSIKKQKLIYSKKKQTTNYYYLKKRVDLSR